MKKIFYVTMIALAVCLPNLKTAAAQSSSALHDLHVTLQGQRLVFQAPKDHCFYDKSKPEHAKALQVIAKRTSVKGLLVGAFAPCDDVLSKQKEPLTPVSTLISGAIIWPGTHQKDPVSLLKKRQKYRSSHKPNFPPASGFDGEHHALYDSIELGERGFALSGYQTHTQVDGWPLFAVGAEAAGPLKGVMLVFTYGAVNAKELSLNDVYQIVQSQATQTK